ERSLEPVFENLACDPARDVGGPGLSGRGAPLPSAVPGRAALGAMVLPMDTLRFITPRSERFVDWTEAYVRVESYFCALRIQNKLLLSQLVAKVLQRTAERLAEEPGESPAALAVAEADRL